MFDKIELIAHIEYKRSLYVIEETLTVRPPDKDKYEQQVQNVLFNWTENNYSCDCNRLLFINRKYGTDFADNCGQECKLTYLSMDGVSLYPPTKDENRLAYLTAIESKLQQHDKIHQFVVVNGKLITAPLEVKFIKNNTVRTPHEFFRTIDFVKEIQQLRG